MQFFNIALTVIAALTMPVNVLALPAAEGIVARTGGGGGGSTTPTCTSSNQQAVCCNGILGIPILGSLCGLISVLSSSCSVSETKCCEVTSSNNGIVVVGITALNCVDIL